MRPSFENVVFYFTNIIIKPNSCLKPLFSLNVLTTHSVPFVIHTSIDQRAQKLVGIDANDMKQNDVRY